ncbi:hypothetical protein GCM10022408_27440 [Hymenobacter fastidiosus]|uniref:Hint domain-containing protein n=1 Tax=Hymenobacter fastidiosus TaxID=486264 RepID=A0ABP7SKQ4_9BACT
MNLAHRTVNLLLILILLLAFLLAAGAALAQKPVKTDVSAYFDRIPVPPTAFTAALRRPAGFAELDKQLQPLSLGTGPGRNAGQTRDAKAQQASGQQAADAGLDQMTEQQQLAYLQQQGASMPGYNAQAVKLAQQMEDPAVQAKLDQMSDAEKTRFMQAQLAPAGSASSQMMADPGFQAAQAEFMQQMENATFSTAWEKKSETEQNAYMARLMRKHGMNEAKMKTMAGPPHPPQSAPLVTTAVMEAFRTMTEAATTEMSTAPFMRLRTQLQQNLEAVLAEQQTRRAPQAREGDCRGQQQQYDQDRQYLKRRMDVMTKSLTQLTATWTAQKTQLKARALPFQTELAKIHYGDDIQRPEEKPLLSVLAGGQQLILSQVQLLASSSSAIYDLNKQYGELKGLYEKPFQCEQVVCFPASAQVALPNGRPVAIQTLRAGDVVLGYDAATGQLVPTRVLRLDVHREQVYPLVQLTIGPPAVYAGLQSVAAYSSKPAAELVLTPNHPLILDDGQLRRADQLLPSDEVVQLGFGGVETNSLTARQPAGAAAVVFNLRTETGNYFVTGILVGSK